MSYGGLPKDYNPWSTDSKEYVLNRIIESECSENPWRHLIVKDFLPKSLYEGVKNETSGYMKNEILEQKGIRGYHIFVNQSVGVFPSTPYLSEYYDILLDESIVNSMKDKLLISQNSKDFYSELNVFTQGYVYDEILPDRSDKLITMLHYLAEDGDDESLGTFLYTPDRDGKQLDVFKDKVKSSPYISNCVLLFAPRDDDNYRTNHCMANKSDKTFLRKSFQTFWMKDEADWTKDKQKGRVKL